MNASAVGGGKNESSTMNALLSSWRYNFVNLLSAFQNAILSSDKCRSLMLDEKCAETAGNELSLDGSNIITLNFRPEICPEIPAFSEAFPENKLLEKTNSEDPCFFRTEFSFSATKFVLKITCSLVKVSRWHPVRHSVLCRGWGVHGYDVCDVD